MSVEELQAALDSVALLDEIYDPRSLGFSPARAMVVKELEKAAHLVANPNIEAARRVLSESPFRIVGNLADRIVAAALTPGDTR